MQDLGGLFVGLQLIGLFLVLGLAACVVGNGLDGFCRAITRWLKK
jgi:hypothetical protein